MSIEPEIVEKRPRRGRPRTMVEMEKVRALKTSPKGQLVRFRHRDFKYAIKAARDAGLENFKVSVDKSGTISVVPMAPDGPAGSEGASGWNKPLDDE